MNNTTEDGYYTEKKNAHLYGGRIYIIRESDLMSAVEERLEKTGQTFSALALQALAKMLKVENPKPLRGRPVIEEIAL